MDRETILRLAREADPFGVDGRLYQMAELTPETIERFAALIEQHLTTNSIHSCHAECDRPICVAVRAEREACAQIAEAIDKNGLSNYGAFIAREIRSRNAP